MYPPPILDLARVRGRDAVECADEYMVVFVLDQATADIRTIHERERRLERTVEAHLLEEPALRGRSGRLTGSRMAAARVRPETAAVVFRERTTLQQRTALRVEHEDRERSMQQTHDVRILLFAHADRDILAVNEDHVLRVMYHDAYSSVCAGDPLPSSSRAAMRSSR